MSRKILISIAFAAAIAVVVLAVVLAPGRARATVTPRQAETPYQLIANAAAHLKDVKSVSGEFTWTNGVLGPSFVLPPKAPAELEQLWAAGRGQLWYQDGKMKLQVGASPDQVTVVKDGRVVWVYSQQRKTVWKYALPAAHDGRGKAWGGKGHGLGPLPGMGSGGFDLGKLPPGVSRGLGQLMSSIETKVTDTTVAGRQAQELTVTPTTTQTTFGSFSVAFDAATYVPLQVRLAAAGSSTPVLSAGFTSVSFDSIATDTFIFTPPADAKVVEVRLSQREAGTRNLRSRGPVWKGAKEGKQLRSAMPEPLTLKQAQRKVGYHLVRPSQPVAALPFQDAWVLKAKGDKGKIGMHAVNGPIVLERYGTGFGTVVVLQGRFGAARQRQVIEKLTEVRLGSSATLGGRKGLEVKTPLVNAFSWRSGNVAYIVAGMVPAAELESFVGALR